MNGTLNEVRTSMAASSDRTPPASPEPAGRPRTSFLGELQRRHVPRVGLFYLAVSWLLLQVADILLPVFDAPAWAMRVLVVVLAAGLPLVLACAWAFELTAEGLQRDVTWADARGHWFAGRVGLITVGILLLAASLFAFSLVTQRNGRQDTPSTTRAADLGMLPYTEFHLALARGDDERAIAAWEAFWRHANVDPSFVRPLVAAVHDSSRRDDAIEVVRALEDRADPGQPGNSIAHRLAPYLRLGAVDAALDELEMRLAQGPHRRFVLLSMLWEPDARAVRASPRFAVFADEVGLVAFWHQRGWPGFCEPAGASLVCRH